MNIRYYLQRLKPSFILFMGIQIIIRLIFVVWERSSLELVNILKALLVGIAFDVVTYALLIIPYVLFLLFLPLRKYHSRLDRIVTSALFVLLTFGLVFDIAAEWAFWEEFAVRFNFIAVDYLVYLDEVVGNILESYPMLPIMLGVSAGVALVYYIFRAQLIPALAAPRNAGAKRKTIGAFFVFILLAHLGMNLQYAKISDNTFANEIAANGIYSLFAAFNNNELSYDHFYLTSAEVGLETPAPRAIKTINPAGPTAKRNVIFIIMESMGAEYMARHGNTENLTPNLNALSAQSLNFTRFYATGTRTVRGLEALTLSIPPAPGDSILKRPENEERFSLGYVFKDQGYATKFIYGGFGYFDNMNYFYANNGFETVDRANMSSDEIHFANVWGVGDEDLFAKVIKEANGDYAKQKPFLYMVMTTSNHQPYTFPPNDGGIPVEGGGRKAGVRYADYAIGKLIASAKKEPWFKNTVFVIVADHTAGASGKTSLPPARYHIPALIYSPGNIAPQQVNKLASQIDLPVTVLARLNMKYQSKFFGQDILDKTFDERAFIATHQQLGVYKDGMVTFVEPVKLFGAETEKGEVLNTKTLSRDSEQVRTAVRNYEGASRWKDEYKKLPTTRIGGEN